MASRFGVISSCSGVARIYFRLRMAWWSNAPLMLVMALVALATSSITDEGWAQVARGQPAELCRAAPPFAEAAGVTARVPFRAVNAHGTGWSSLQSSLDHDGSYHYTAFVQQQGHVGPLSVGPALFWWNNKTSRSHPVATEHPPLQRAGYFVSASTDRAGDGEFAILTSDLPYEDPPGRSRQLFVEVIASGVVKKKHPLGGGIWGVGQPHAFASNAPGFLVTRNPGEPSLFASVRHNAVDLIPIPRNIPLDFASLARSSGPTSPIRVGSWSRIDQTFSFLALDVEKRMWRRELDVTWDVRWPMPLSVANDAGKHYLSIDANLSAAFVLTPDACLAIVARKAAEPFVRNLSYCFRTPLTSDGVTWLGVERALDGDRVWGVGDTGLTSTQLEGCSDQSGQLALIPLPQGIALGRR